MPGHVISMEGLGAAIRPMHPGASLASLDFKVVVPVRPSTSEQLPKARCSIRKKKERTPALELLNMNSLMWADALKLFFCDGEDDVAKDNAAERKTACKLAATGLTLAIGDFQGAR